MPTVLVPLAQGCEELEAVTVIDLLRRAGIDVVTAGLDSAPVKASRGVTLIPDTTLDTLMERDFDMMVLPGGLPGADHLNADPRIHTLFEAIGCERQIYRGNLCCPQGVGRRRAVAGATGNQLPRGLGRQRHSRPGTAPRAGSQ